MGVYNPGRMDPAITITLSDDGEHGRYEARVEGRDGVGELAYSYRSPKVVVAYHTGVPDSLRGTGVGKALVEQLISDARKQGLRIVPRCPFVLAQFKRHPEWSDLMEE